MRCALPWNESNKNWKMNTTLDKSPKKKKPKINVEKET